MASTNGKYFENRDSDRYGVLGLDHPLPEDAAGDFTPQGGGESTADSPESAHRGGGDGELRDDFTTGEASPPPVLSDQQVPQEVQDLLQDTGEWDALDAIYDQLHQVQATLHRLRKALRALTDAKIAALPGNSAARLLKCNRKSSNRDDVPPMLKSEAEESPDPEPVPVSRAAKKPQEPEVDFHPVVRREPGETPPPRPRRASTIEPLCTQAAGSERRVAEKSQQNGRTRAVRWSPDHAHTADRRSPECDVDSATRRPAVDRFGEVGRPVPSADDKPSRRSSRVLTDEVRSTMVHYLEAGLSIRQAAAFVGCHHTTIVKAMQRDRLLAERIERAREIGRAMPLVRIIRASRRCWRAAAWLVRHQRAGDTAQPEGA
jgi:hypothetical protein